MVVSKNHWEFSPWGNTKTKLCPECEFYKLLVPFPVPSSSCLSPSPCWCLCCHHQGHHFFLAFAYFLSLCNTVKERKVIVLGAGFLHLATEQIYLLMWSPEWTLSLSWWSCPALHWWKVTLTALTQHVLTFPQYGSLLAMAVCPSSACP